MRCVLVPPRRLRGGRLSERYGSGEAFEGSKDWWLVLGPVVKPLLCPARELLKSARAGGGAGGRDDGFGRMGNGDLSGSCELSWNGEFCLVGPVDAWAWGLCRSGSSVPSCI